MKLNDRLFELRRKSGLSQEELAARIGVSRQAVGKWENGTSVPELDKLIALAEFYNISIGDLLGMESPPEEPAAETSPGPDLSELKELLETIASQQREAAERPHRSRTWLWVLLAAAGVFLAAVIITLAVYTSYTRQELTRVQLQVQETERTLAGDIVDMHATLAGILLEQNSLFSDWSCETLDYDKASGLLTVRAAVTPKSLGRDMTARLSLVDDETGETFEAEAELADGVFSAVIQAPEGAYSLWAVLAEEGSETRGEAGDVFVSPGDLAVTYGVSWFRGPAQSVQEGDGFTWEPRGLLVIDSRMDRPLTGAQITVRVGGQIVNTIPLDLADPANWYTEYTLPEDILSAGTVTTGDGRQETPTRPASLMAVDGDMLFALEVDLGPFHCAYRHWVEITLTATDELGVEYRFALLDMHMTSENEPVPPDLNGELEAD